MSLETTLAFFCKTVKTLNAPVTGLRSICALASQSLRFIQSSIRMKSPAIREMASKTLVHPFEEYSSSVWNPYPQRTIHKIEMMERRVARWTLDNYSRQASVTEMLTHLVWHSLEQRKNESRLYYYTRSFMHGLQVVAINHLFHIQIIMMNSVGKTVWILINWLLNLKRNQLIWFYTDFNSLCLVSYYSVLKS